MRILAIETSAAAGSLAVVDGRHVVTATLLPPTQRNAKTLAPALHRVLDEVGRDQLDGIAVSIGPGSFTGLRVGIATAKTIGWALNLPIAGVPTLEAIARQTIQHLRQHVGPDATPKEGERLSVASNAYRSQVFTYDTLIADGQPSSAGAFALRMHTDWLSSLAEFDWVTGPALRLTAPKTFADILDTIRVAPEPLWDPTAVTIGHIGEERLSRGESVEPTALLPEYGRLSAAEEKRQAEQGDEV